MNKKQRVKIFRDIGEVRLENNINDFLDNPKIKILHVLQSQVLWTGSDNTEMEFWTTITIFYEEE